MRYAFVSDLHANLHAWTVVIHDIAAHEVNQIICLGDLVGYGPDPAPVLESVREYTDSILLGNHDAAAAGVMDADSFYGEAQEVISWTRQVLSPDDLAFLQRLPLSLAGPDFRCTHGDFEEPGAFDYLEDEEAARIAWDLHDDRLLVIGHTHLPAVHKLDPHGTYVPMKPENFMLEQGCRYIVNVGSVGMSRDGDHRASYCIYDDVEQYMMWRRIDYNVKNFKEYSESVIGWSEQISFLYADYVRAKSAQDKPKPKPVHDARAFMTTQDLSGLVQEYSPDKTHTPAKARSVKKIKIKRKADFIKESPAAKPAARPPSASQRKPQGRTAPAPASSRSNDRTARSGKRAAGSKTPLVIGIIIGAILLLSLLIASSRAKARLRRRGQSTRNGGGQVVAGRTVSLAPVNGLQFDGLKGSHAVWDDAFHPTWPKNWTIETWVVPKRDGGSIIQQGQKDNGFGLVYENGDSLRLVIRGESHPVHARLSPTQANQVALTSVYDDTKKETRIYVIANGKACKVVTVMGAFTPMGGTPILFMNACKGILEYVTLFSGTMNNDYAAIRYQGGKSGDHNFGRMPGTMHTIARFVFPEGSGETTADSQPGAKQGASLKLKGSPRWVSSSLGY